MYRQTPQNRRRAKRSGFTLIEMIVSMVVFLIAASGVVSTMVTSSNLSRHNREIASAAQAAENLLEELATRDFAEIFVLYNDDPGDDPGPGPAPGSGFDVPGLRVQEGDADGAIGTIEFPTVAGALREDAVDPRLGMPRDLSLDTIIDNLDHATDYELLPIRIRINWRGSSGDQEYLLHLTLANV